MTLGQRWAYLCGGIQWYGDLLGVLFFFCLLVGAANIMLSGGLVFRKLTGFLLAAIPLLVVLGLVECVFALLGLAGIAGSVASRGTPGGFLLGALLLWPTVGFLAAPYNSLSAQRAALPPDLRERRRTEYLRYGKRS